MEGPGIPDGRLVACARSSFLVYSSKDVLHHNSFGDARIRSWSRITYARLLLATPAFVYVYDRQAIHVAAGLRYDTPLHRISLIRQKHLIVLSFVLAWASRCASVAQALLSAAGKHAARGVP